MQENVPTRSGHGQATLLYCLGQALRLQILKNMVPEKMFKMLRKKGSQVCEDLGLTTGILDETPFSKAS